jgi:hypothetical protein
MLVGDPSSGYSYKCTVNDVALAVETAVAGNYVTLTTTQTISGAKTFSNILTLTSVANSPTDTDKFLVLSASNVVNYRTGTQVLSDIGAADDSLVVHKAGTETITGVKTFNAGLSLPNYQQINLSNGATIEGYDGKILFRTVYGTAGYFQNNSLGLAQMDNETGTTGIGFLVKNFGGEGLVKYKTAAQALSMIGAQGALTLTTTGSSGVATLVSNTLNIPNYTLAGLGGVSGSGTTNYIPKFTGANSLGNSVIYDASGSIGIGTTTPQTILEVYSDTESNVRFHSGGAGGDQASIYVKKGTGNGLIFGEENRDFIWQFGSGALTNGGGTEAMRLTSTGLGIGTSSPAAKLDVYQSATGTTAFNTPIQRLINTGTATLNQRIDLMMRWEDGTYNGTGGISMIRESATGRSGSLVFSSINSSGDATQAMRLDASGNLGLGVTPSAWFSTIKAIDINTNGSIWSGAGVDVGVSGNAYYINTGPKYKTSAAATDYWQLSGEHRWYNAPSGTAGNAISFTQAMTLDASGRLGIGTTSPNFRLESAISTLNGISTPIRATNSSIASLSTGQGVQIAFANDIGFDATASSSAIRSTTTNIGNGAADLSFLNWNGSALTERMRITSGGNVGIGTTSPNYQLTVGTPGTTTDAFIQLGSATTGTGNIYFGDATGTGTASYAGFIRYSHSADQMLFGTSSANAMSINSLGSVGIGTTSVDASAIVQITSTTKGFLPPVMTGAQAEAISATPAAGLLVYANNGNGTVITSIGWWGYDGTTWVKLN